MTDTFIISVSKTKTRSRNGQPGTMPPTWTERRDVTPEQLMPPTQGREIISTTSTTEHRGVAQAKAT